MAWPSQRNALLMPSRPVPPKCWFPCYINHAKNFCLTAASWCLCFKRDYADPPSLGQSTFPQISFGEFGEKQSHRRLQVDEWRDWTRNTSNRILHLPKQHEPDVSLHGFSQVYHAWRGLRSNAPSQERSNLLRHSHETWTSRSSSLGLFLYSNDRQRLCSWLY